MLKDEVVTLELSKKLKDLGFPQKKSSLKWYGFYGIQCYSVERQEYTLQTANVEDDCVIEIDAPLATEILRELPDKITDKLDDELYLKMNKKDVAFSRCGDFVSETKEMDLQNNLAKMWIWLKENDLLTHRATDGEQ